MDKKIIILMFVVMLSLSMISATKTNIALSTKQVQSGDCYQESANVSTSCGGLNNGNYSGSSLSQFLNLNNYYDGNWNSFTHVGNSGDIADICRTYGKNTSSAYLQTNYKRNTLANSAYLTIKYGNRTDNFTQNITLPTTCINTDVNIRIYSTASGAGVPNPLICLGESFPVNINHSININNTITINCLNSTGSYINLLSFENQKNPINIFEEAIVWNNTEKNKKVHINIKSKEKPATMTTSVTDGLVAWWKLLGNADDSIGGNDGSVVGSVNWEDNALKLTGSNNNYINVNSNSAIEFGTNNFTITTWIKTSDGNWQVFLDKYYGSDWYLDIWSGDAEFNHASDYMFKAYNFGQWNMLTFTRNGNIGKICIDTSCSGYVGFFTGENYVNTNDMIMGCDSTGTNCLNGYMSSLKIYNRSLSNAEISQIYSEGRVQTSNKKVHIAIRK